MTCFMVKAGPFSQCPLLKTMQRVWNGKEVRRGVFVKTIFPIR